MSTSLPVSSSEPRSPLIVERYAIHDEFAAGGMATVHFARLLGAQGFRRTVAAKRLLPHLTRDSDFSLMLIDEARMAARVRHPNVVSTLDVVQTDTELVLVMEYVHGESLAKLVRAAQEQDVRIPLPIAAAIIIDALHGLHAAHEATDERGQPLDLVHRDVSPQNLLVGTDGITRIADFGIAKAAGRVQSTPDGAVKGKLWYMAPEQLEGGVVTRTTDVFATAVVLWELLTGERLFAGDSQSESICKVLIAPIPAPSTSNPALPAALDAVVARGLARDPAARYATAREMALALERVAPPIRPSEIAAWVEQVTGPALARRASLLASIEHAHGPDGDVDGDAATELLQRVDASALRAGSDAVLQTPVTRSGMRGLGAQVAAAVQAQPQPRPRWPLLLAGALVILGVLGGSLWLTRSRPLGVPTATPEGAAPTVPTAAPARAAPPSTLAPASPPAPAPAEPQRRAPEPTPASRAAAPHEKSPGRSERRPARASTPDCDPPYSIDTEGKILFKLECM